MELFVVNINNLPLTELFNVSNSYLPLINYLPLSMIRQIKIFTIDNHYLLFTLLIKLFTFNKNLND